MRTYLTWILAASVLASPSLLEAGTLLSANSERNRLVNVELRADGTVTGQLLLGNGTSISGAEIKVHGQKDLKQVRKAIMTDDNGRFVVDGLNSGTLVLTTGQDSFACRVWRNGTAPPKSLGAVALVKDTEVVRGQNRPGFLQRIRTLTTGQKVGLGLVVAAAIALPIILSDDDDNAS